MWPSSRKSRSAPKLHFIWSYLNCATGSEVPEQGMPSILTGPNGGGGAACLVYVIAVGATAELRDDESRLISSLPRMRQ